MIKRSWIYVVFVIFLFSCESSPYRYPWLNPAVPLQERVDSLVSRLTLEEKVSLLMPRQPAIPRLGIQSFCFGGEALHGLAYVGRATVFPQAIGLAATFDEALLYRIAVAISDEARAKSKAIRQLDAEAGTACLCFFSPNINIFRDPRWGRGQETYGEDPYLTSVMGVAFVKGMQGDHPRYLKTIACAKHYVCHSGPENNRCLNNPQPSLQELAETYTPAFNALINKAGVKTVMVTYNFYHGVPLCANKPIIDYLKNQLHFRQLVITDGGALDNMHGAQHYTPDAVHTVAAAINAGIDLELGNVFQHLPEAVKQGMVRESQIDSAVRKVLALRFLLGEFDPDYMNPYQQIPVEVLHCSKHIALAREAAAKSIVLLKNKNHVLPLRKDIKKLFVLGPTATNGDVLLGNYNGFSSNMNIFLEGIVAKIHPGTYLTYRQGCRLDEPNVTKADWADVSHQFDAIIACMGITPHHEGEEGEPINSPANGDRLDLNLPRNQIDYLKKQRAYGTKPIILVLTGGSPVITPEIYDLADAVLYVWYPGEEGGNALADVIFGDVVPSGRLPVTFPQSMSQIPDFSDYSMNKRTYRYMDEEPLFPFGFGLSYTSFSYGGIRVNKDRISAKENCKIEVTLTNTGRYDAEEVTQLYVSYTGNLKNKPLYSLKRIQRNYLRAGESKVLSFELTPEVLSLADEKGVFHVFPGKYIIYVGGSCPHRRSTALGAPAPAELTLWVER